MKSSKISTTHQKNQKQRNDKGNHHVDNKTRNDDSRSNNENTKILEQIFSDMTWYG